MRVVGSVLVRNEDVFVKRAIRNVAEFCDRIHALDHLSDDRTFEILSELASEFDHLEVRRSGNAGVSHAVLEPYVGTDTWALRVDGDELYDPVALARMRELLESGELVASCRVQGTVLHCTDLDEERGRARGYLSPPSRPITSLYNLGALDAWTGCPERLHGGRMTFRPGYAWDVVHPLHERFSWDDTPLRYLHVCFLRRSSLDADEDPRLGLAETGLYQRGALASAVRAVRRTHVAPRLLEMQERGTNWKLEKYRRGPAVLKDVSDFLELGTGTA